MRAVVDKNICGCSVVGHGTVTRWIEDELLAALPEKNIWRGSGTIIRRAGRARLERILVFEARRHEKPAAKVAGNGGKRIKK